MCGIIGAIGPSAKSLVANMDKALMQIRHRGPDSNGYWFDEKNNVLLGHVRLAILDLSENGNQPFFHKKNVLVYNGEVYNHKEFRLPGHFYVSESDTETLAHLGESLSYKIKKFVGMFAGAFWLAEQNELVVFRDTMGIKPLLYARLNDGTFVFGSDERGLFALAPELVRKVNISTLEKYLCYENYNKTDSFFKGIQSLAPGEMMSVKSDPLGGITVRSERFQYEPDSDLICDQPDVELRFDQELCNSVQRHLLSDVPVAVYLSGGIDSSLVASMAAKYSRDQVSGFTGYFEERGEFDESSISLAVARNAGIKYTSVKICSHDFIHDLDELILNLGQPRMGFGSFSQGVVARKVRETHKVVLSGHGGDELFWGYPFMEAVNSMLDGKSDVSRSAKVFKYYLRFKEIFGSSIPIAPKIFERENLSPEFLLSGKNKNAWINELKKYYQEIYMHGLLQVEDRVSMQYSLETRMPIWSQPIQFLANSVDPRQHMKSRPKDLLKKISKKYLPPEVFAAPKRGFPTPLRLWLRNELYGFAYERISQENEILDLVAPRKQRIGMLDSYRKYSTVPFWDEKRTHQIWMLLCLESWSRQFKVG